MYKLRMDDLTSKLNTSEDDFKESQIAFNEINAIYLNETIKNTNKE